MAECPVDGCDETIPHLHNLPGTADALAGLLGTPSGGRKFPAYQDCGGAAWQANPGPTGEPDMKTVRPCWRCKGTGNALMPLRDGEVGEPVPYGTDLAEFVIAIRAESDWADADTIWSGLGGCLVRPLAVSPSPSGDDTTAAERPDQALRGVRVRGLTVHVENPRCEHEACGEDYCGDPECDIYYCPDCGDEFYEPCPRHEGVPYEVG